MSIFIAIGAAAAAGALPYAAWNGAGVKDRGDVARSGLIAGAVAAPLLAHAAPALLLATVLQIVDPLPQGSAKPIEEGAEGSESVTADFDTNFGKSPENFTFSFLRGTFFAAGVLAACVMALWQTGLFGAVVSAGSSSGKNKGSVLAISTTIAAKVVAIACGWAGSELVWMRFSNFWGLANDESLDIQSLGLASLEAAVDFLAIIGTTAAVYLASCTPLKTLPAAALETGTSGKKSSPAAAAPSNDWLDNTAARTGGKNAAAVKRAARRAETRGETSSSDTVADAAPSVNPSAIPIYVLAAILAAFPSFWRSFLGSNSSIVYFAIRAGVSIGLAFVSWTMFTSRTAGSKK